MYRRYKILRKYLDDVATEETKRSDVFYDNVEYPSYDDCLSGSTGGYVGDDIINHPYYNQYFTVEMLESGNIHLDKENTFQYSINGGEWKDLDTTTLSVNAGDKVRMKYVTDSSYYSSDVALFGTFPKCNIYGNINSMYAGDDFKTKLNTYNSMFYYWFSDTPVVDASNLVLPYTSFDRSSVYSCMFQGCTTLVKAPSVLPSINLNTSCYSYMFRNCTSLETVPILPATTLADQCYMDMFRDCPLLETAPELPAKTLVNNCYYEMFSGCSSLNYIKCLAEQYIGTYKNTTNNWVSGVSSTGTFVKKSGVSWGTGVTYIPKGWTVEEVE